MLPVILVAVGAYLIGDSVLGDKKYADGGMMAKGGLNKDSKWYEANYKVNGLDSNIHFVAKSDKEAVKLANTKLKRPNAELLNIYFVEGDNYKIIYGDSWESIRDTPGGMMAKGGKTDEFADVFNNNVITEREINLIKTRLNNNREDQRTQDVVQYIWDNNPKLTGDQNAKGIKFLRNLWKSPTGKERINNPFGYREQDALETFEYFELAGFHDISRYGQRKFYVPLYNVIGNDSNFQYYYDGNVNIVGKDGMEVAKGGMMANGGENFDFIKSAIESASGDKISKTPNSEVYYSTINPEVAYYIKSFNRMYKKDGVDYIIIKYDGVTGERYPIGELKDYMADGGMMAKGGKIAVRNEGIDEVSLNGKKRYGVEIQDEESGDVLDYEYFDSEKEANKFISRYKKNKTELPFTEFDKRMIAFIERYDERDSLNDSSEYAYMADGGMMAKGGDVQGKTSSKKQDEQRFAKPTGVRWKDKAVKKGVASNSDLAKSPSKKMQEKYPKLVYTEKRSDKSDVNPSVKYKSI
jgi:hypothetical protein